MSRPADSTAATDALLEIAAVLIDMDADGTLSAGRTHSFHVKPFEGCAPRSRPRCRSRESTRIIRCGPRCPSGTRCRESSGKSATRVRAYNCRRAILVGHNAAFDLGFLNAAVARADVKRNPFHPFSCFDTATLAGAALGQTVLAKAVTVAGLEWDSSSAHSASYDAERSADIFCLICNRLRDELSGCRRTRPRTGVARRAAAEPGNEDPQMESSRRGRQCSGGAVRRQRPEARGYFAAPTSASSFFSSPLRYISSAMSQPPTSSPFTYSCG